MSLTTFSTKLEFQKHNQFQLKKPWNLSLVYCTGLKLLLQALNAIHFSSEAQPWKTASRRTQWNQGAVTCWGVETATKESSDIATTVSGESRSTTFLCGIITLFLRSCRRVLLVPKGMLLMHVSVSTFHSKKTASKLKIYRISTGTAVVINLNDKDWHM